MYEYRTGNKGTEPKQFMSIKRISVLCISRKVFALLLSIILVIMLSSCQYISRSVQQSSQIDIINEMLRNYADRLDSMTKRIEELEEQLSRTRLSAETLRTKVEKNYLMLLTLNSSVTILDFLHLTQESGSDTRSPEQMPDMQSIEKTIRERVTIEMERIRNAQNSETGAATPENVNAIALLNSEIEKLKADYRQLRWQNYKDNRLPSDPFSLDDLSLVLGGKIEYVIQSGDTLSQIAVAFGLGTDGAAVLMSENHIQDAKLIRSGQVLRIPLPPLQERITIPLGGKNRLEPEDIVTFFGESTGSGISRGLAFRILRENAIVSCLPGRVIDTGSSYVVVYHGNGLKAVYNLLNELYVKKGDWIMSGQAIGACAPPEFRLEIMIDFEYRDPMLLFLQNMGNFQVTFYTEWDDGNLPFFPYFRRTKEGGFAKEWYTVAADPTLISPGTMIYVPNLRSTPSRGLFMVEDTGSAIQNRKLDVYIRDIQEASKMKVTTEVYRFKK